MTGWKRLVYRRENEGSAGYEPKGEPELLRRHLTVSRNRKGGSSDSLKGWGKCDGLDSICMNTYICMNIYIYIYIFTYI